MTSLTTPQPPAHVIRAWARANGMPVGDRGRLSPALIDAYTTAHAEVTA